MLGSLFLSLIVLASLGHWAADHTLSQAAADWIKSWQAERCLMIKGRVEAGRLNLAAAAHVTGADPSAAIQRWQERYPVSACHLSHLSTYARREVHPQDQGVNWVMQWRRGEP